MLRRRQVLSFTRRRQEVSVLTQPWPTICFSSPWVLEEIACSHSARQRLSSHSTGPEYDPSTPTTSNALFLQTQSKFFFQIIFSVCFLGRGRGRRRRGEYCWNWGGVGRKWKVPSTKNAVLCVWKLRVLSQVPTSRHMPPATCTDTHTRTHPHTLSHQEKQKDRSLNYLLSASTPNAP